MTGQARQVQLERGDARCELIGSSSDTLQINAEFSLKSADFVAIW